MTRFNELKRIETALRHKDHAELQWAMAYCKTRLQIATRKDHEKYWRSIEKKVREASTDEG